MNVSVKWLAAVMLAAPAHLFSQSLPCAGGTGCAAPQRTVSDIEVGSIFTAPEGGVWSGLGAYVGDPYTVNFGYLPAGALKISHGRFHITKPSDDTSWTYFPYTKFKQYESQEVAAGRPPLSITATYMGKKRPVLWAWSLALSGNVPTSPSSYWKQPLNVADDRYVKYWINQYARPILWKNLKDDPSRWIGLDECAFLPSYYGVLDDSNHFVAGVKWDLPFPQSDSEYYTMIQTFFKKLKMFAPDIKVMSNVGSLGDWSQIQNIYANVDGIMVEEIYDPDITHISRLKYYNMLTFYTWAGDQGKVAILRTNLDPSNPARIRAAYAAYMLLRGKSTFFAPRIAGTSSALPQSYYEDMRNALGEAVAPMQSQLTANAPNAGSRLYWRDCEGGTVYVNYTGQTTTIPFPTNRAYYNAAGQQITSLTLADLGADYVLYSQQPRAARPIGTPYFNSVATAPVTLALSSTESGAIVRYETNGSTPTSSSPIASTPITLYGNTTVKTVASVTGKASSFPTSATYYVASNQPTVQFYYSSDTGSAGTYYPLLRLSAAAQVPISISYQYQLGSAIQNGSVTFKPGETFKYFPIATQAGLTAKVTLTSASGATIGTKYIFYYPAK
jgi:hypothetical protein